MQIQDEFLWFRLIILINYYFNFHSKLKFIINLFIINTKTSSTRKLTKPKEFIKLKNKSSGFVVLNKMFDKKYNPILLNP